MALLVYVDDLVLTRNDSDACLAFKAYLHNYFRIKDLGRLKYFLAIEVACNSQGLFLSQHKYALEIVEECGSLAAKPVDFPMETNHKLGLAMGKVLDDPTQCRRLVGCLILLIGLNSAILSTFCLSLYKIPEKSI